MLVAKADGHVFEDIDHVPDITPERRISNTKLSPSLVGGLDIEAHLEEALHEAVGVEGKAPEYPKVKVFIRWQ